MADKKKPTYTTFVTPVGVAIYPRLNAPDEYKGKKTYKTQLKLPADAVVKVKGEEVVLKDLIDEQIEQHYEATKADLETKIAEEKGEKKAKAKKALETLTKEYPYAAAFDDDGEETGDLVFKFKKNAEYKDAKGKMVQSKLTLIDAKKNPVNPAVWGGSEIKVSSEIFPYYSNATDTVGVSLRMRGVQIITLVQGSGGAVNDFDEEEGYEGEAEDKSTDKSDDSDDEDDEF